MPAFLDPLPRESARVPCRDGTVSGGLLPRPTPASMSSLSPSAHPQCCDLCKDSTGLRPGLTGQGGHRTPTHNTRQLWFCFGKNQTTLPGGGGLGLPGAEPCPRPTSSETAHSSGSPAERRAAGGSLSAQLATAGLSTPFSALTHPHCWALPQATPPPGLQSSLRAPRVSLAPSLLSCTSLQGEPCLSH